MHEHFDPADANLLARRYLDSLLIEERLVDAQVPDLTLELWGETFASPVMTPAFSHLKPYAEGRESGMLEYSRAAAEANLVNWVGMMENDDYRRILATGARTIRIIKPYADRDKVLDQLACAARGGSFAVGMDIDHIFGRAGYDVVLGEPMTSQTMDNLKEYVSATPLPFVIKGVLSVSDAVKCAECGVKGIVVSHHHGRMPYAIPPLAVLPRIADALKGSDVRIFVDCAIERGADVFKALALGADAVSLGRGMMTPLQDGGVQGLLDYIHTVHQELGLIMGFTGCRNIEDPEPGMLWKDGSPLG